MFILDIQEEIDRIVRSRREHLKLHCETGQLTPREALDRLEMLTGCATILRAVHNAGCTTVESVASLIARSRALNNTHEISTPISIKVGAQ